MPSPVHLGVDFGTSHTVAVLSRDDGSATPLLFDGSPLLPSSVYAQADGELFTGRDALHSARIEPARFEPHPKRRVDDGSVMLGDVELPVQRMFSAVLSRVRDECVRVAGSLPATTLTHPAVWGPARRLVLEDAATEAGFVSSRLLPEPVAAATYFVQGGRNVPVGSGVVVYDFGGGTFDVSVVARTATGLQVVAVDGSPELGGVDLDHALFHHVGAHFADSAEWRRLADPRTPEDRRHHRLFSDDVRLAKERLSRHTSVDVMVPMVDRQIHLTRDELESVTRPLLDKAVRLTKAVIRAARLPAEHTAGVFLVGGASRMPLVATLLHQSTGIAPTVIDQPEVVVAHGATLPSPGDARSSPPRQRVAAPPVAATVPAVAGMPGSPPVSPAAAPRVPPSASPPLRVPPPVSPPRSSTNDRPRTMTIALAIMVFQTAAWALISIFSLVYITQDIAEGDRPDDFFMPGFPVFVTAGAVIGIAAWQLGRSSSPRRRLGLTAEYGVAAMCYLAVSLAIMEVPDGAYPLGTVLIAVASLPAMVVIPLLHRPEVRDRCRSDAPRPGWLIVVQVVMWSQVIPVAFAAYVGLIEFGGLDAGETASRGNGSLAYGWPIYVFVVGTTVAGVLQLHHRQPVNRRLALAAEYVMPVYIFAILILVFEVGMAEEDPALWSASVCAAPLAFVIPMLHMRRAREWFDHAPDHE